MPTDVWVDEMDGPERHDRAKKRRAEQLKRWETREATSNDEPQSKRKHKRTLKFAPNIVMLEAAARNDLDEVASLLESGINPDLANEDGLTALHQSCIDGCDDMVKYLIEHKANVNACDNERWTPLHAAAACGHISIIQYLLKNGGDIMALNLDGNLPAGVVDDNEEVEKLLDKEMLKLGYDEAAIEELRLNQGKQLLNDLKDSVKNGRSLDIQDEEGATAFHVAAANGWTNVIDFLLENEADFEITDNDGWQAIHAAAAWGHDTILEILVASGADLDSQTNDSSTPLDLTEETEIIELIEELKTKEVKYPRKGKGVRRKRSNTSNSSIKRTSIHEKSELSHSDSKAERAALLKQLSQEEEELSPPPVVPVNTPVTSHNTPVTSHNTPVTSHNTPVTSHNTPVTSHSTPVTSLNMPVTSLNTPVTSHTPDGQSNSSRDETNSSGYVSEASSDAKTEEKNEVVKTSEITVNIDNKKDEGKTENKENSLKVTTEKNKASTNIKQSPVPKPPRLGTSNSISRHEPQAYINIEIEPAESKSKTTSSSKPEPNIKQDLPKTQNESLKPSTDNKARNTELKTRENANKEHDTNPLERRTTSTLPKLASTDKRKAPEPPDVATNTKHASLSEKDSKKANRSRTRSSESSSKKRCTIL